MILFIVSFLMIFLSSYLITSVLAKKNDVCGIFYLPVIAFAQIVLDFEVLSLFNAISTGGVLILNLIVLAAAFGIWKYKQKSLWYINPQRFFRRLWYGVCKDKYLFTLFLGFCIFFAVSVFLIIISPVVNDDASAYHVSRSVFWIINKNLNHFNIGDIRNIVFPVNSEILYSWVILFTRKLVFLGAFSFVGYLLSICGIYNILDLLKFDIRKKLWVIFILTSFSSVTILSSGTETDIIIAGLVISAVYLFWRGVKDKFMTPLFISAMVFALAIGTKTTAFFVIPGVGLGFCALAYYYQKRVFYKPVLYFLGFGIINFILLSSYNYILNYINFGDISGPYNFTLMHKNIFGLKAIPAHIVKYLFLFIDFTGFKWADYVGEHILHLRDGIISSMNLSFVADGVFTSKTVVVNKSLLEPLAGMGVVGMLTFIPAWLISFIKPVFSKNKKTFAILGFGLLFLINLVVISYVLIYMSFNIRFLTTFCMISAPVLVYTYSRKNNPYKFIVVFFAMFSLLLISTHIWARPFFRIVNYMKHGVSITLVRKVLTESILLPQILNWRKYPVTDMASALRDYLSGFDKSNKILYFSSLGEEILPLVMMNLYGYHIDFGLISDIEDIDLSQYNIIIIIEDEQDTFWIKRTNIDYCAYDGVYKDNEYVFLKAKCTLPSEFYAAKGFVFYDGFDKIDYNSRLINEKLNIEKYDSLDYYKIYENKNNPIIRK